MKQKMPFTIEKGTAGFAPHVRNFQNAFNPAQTQHPYKTTMYAYDKDDILNFINGPYTEFTVGNPPNGYWWTLCCYNKETTKVDENGDVSKVLMNCMAPTLAYIDAEGKMALLSIFEVVGINYDPVAAYNLLGLNIADVPVMNLAADKPV